MEETKQVELHKEKRTLRYDFTAPETHDLSLSLANKTKERLSIEEEKKSVASQYKAKLDEANATINKLSNWISDGYEWRDVEVTTEYHVPEKGRKTMTRLDTGYQWHEKMDSYEYNLFNQPEEEEGNENTDGEGPLGEGNPPEEIKTKSKRRKKSN